LLEGFHAVETRRFFCGDNIDISVFGYTVFIQPEKFSAISLDSVSRRGVSDLFGDGYSQSAAIRAVFHAKDYKMIVSRLFSFSGQFHEFAAFQQPFFFGEFP
jgi:hypothetical protein